MSPGHSFREEIQELDGEIEAWVAAFGDQVADAYDRSEFPHLEQFRDRTIDVTQPLAAILEVAYEGDPRLEKVRRELLEAITITRSNEQAQVRDHLILLHCGQHSEPTRWACRQG